MSIALVGYTGFVGSNIRAAAGDSIDGLYNSKNIEEAFGTNPKLLIYAGLRAEKYLANNEPDKDMALIEEAKRNIEKINPEKVVLISTVDVLKTPNGMDEDCAIETNGLHAYGYNRYMLELWVIEKYPSALIIRLPGLFGSNIKKNFIYDYINVIPFMLKNEKMEELGSLDGELKSYYEAMDNGFYRVKSLDDAKSKVLKEKFRLLGFSALNFTDSRNVYQFYNLRNLWGDINTCLENDITLWHPATEPVSAGELYKYLCGKEFINKLSGDSVYYDYRTKHDKVFGGKNGYICDKNTVMEHIKSFTESMA